jgi:hypothetical protein
MRRRKSVLPIFPRRRKKCCNFGRFSWSAHLINQILVPVPTRIPQPLHPLHPLHPPLRRYADFLPGVYVDFTPMFGRARMASPAQTFRAAATGALQGLPARKPFAARLRRFPQYPPPLVEQHQRRFRAKLGLGLPVRAVGRAGRRFLGCPLEIGPRLLLGDLLADLVFDRTQRFEPRQVVLFDLNDAEATLGADDP